MERMSAIVRQTVGHCYGASHYHSHAPTTSQALDCMLSKGAVEEAVGDQLIIERSEKTKVLHIQLNRPTKLNVLSLSMVQYLAQLFPAIRHTPLEDCSAVVITGSKGKAFCAGGDIKEISAGMKLELCQKYFTNEYCMDLWPRSLNRPAVSIWDGLTLGGGVGLTLYGKYRIATEATEVAMPETRIGFFPDAGATFWMSRLTHGMGLYLGLTGMRLNAADALEMGLATHYIQQHRLPALMDHLMTGRNTLNSSNQETCNKETGNRETSNKERCNRDHVSVNLMTPLELDKLVSSLQSTPTISPTLTLEIREQIKRIFENVQSPTELTKRLASGVRENSHFAIQTLNTIKRMCPLTCAIWIELHRRGPSLSLSQCVNLEYQLCQSLFINDPHSNFREGVQAVLIDHRDANWKPNSLSDITPEAVDVHFNYKQAKQLFEMPELEFPPAEEEERLASEL